MKTKTVVKILVIMTIVTGGVYALLPLCVARVRASQPCSNNLLCIDGAKQQWVLENKAKAGDSVTLENILPYLKKTPTCNVPSGKYIVGKVCEEPRCTIHGTFTHFKPDHY